MRVLILEDDSFHEAFVQRALKLHFKQIEFLVARTEKEFVLTRFDEIASQNWTVAILDQMLPWTTEDDEDVFGKAPAEGPLRAGTRCYERLKSDVRTAKIPVIFFTNLDGSAVPKGVEYVRKKSDPKLQDLISKIDALKQS